MARVSPRRSSSSSSTSSCSRARRSPPPAGRDSASPSVARSSRDTPGGSGPRTPPTAVRSSSVSCPAASPPRPGKSVAAARRVRYHHRFQMIPDVLHLGPIPIHIFGIFLALAFLAASAAASREFARKGYDPALGSSAVVWAAVGGIVGARLWLVLDAWPEFVRAPADFLWNGGGFVFYGGLVGAAPAIALGQAIGRLGCQLAGDGDWGKETTLPWGMAYPYAVVGWDKPAGVVVHPTPLYESAAYFAVFFFLWRMRRVAAPEGTVFWWYLLLASTARFLVEFVRVNATVALGLTEAQLTSLVLLGIGGWQLLAQRRWHAAEA